ncbi:hypothetical protein Tco_0108851 [Tanacetum coccineum]
MQKVTFKGKDRLELVVPNPMRKKDDINIVVRFQFQFHYGTSSDDVVVSSKRLHVLAPNMDTSKKVYPTYRDVSQALGMLADDQEWMIALQESVMSANSFLRDILNALGDLFGGKSVMLDGKARIPDESDAHDTSWVTNGDKGIAKLISFINDEQKMQRPTANG